eukprot:TRINITY_DN11842_c0_g1_i3.p1 TRINITY_DN11842_c0_g1~~TRINITY_DN11842_c0_g1_i3.p1  ORF type:complete len:417 (+),score=77.99 TRINITY_DN11842_c0_g1_i3:358-1608(+)
MARLDVLCLLFTTAIADSTLRPMIVVPGLSASNLTYSLKDAKTSHFICLSSLEDQQLWPTPLWAWLGQDLFDCWANSIRTVYNASTGSFGNRPGETVKPFPPSNNGDYPPPDNEPPMDVKFNVTRMPFDWRLPLSGLTQFYIDMKALIEELYALHHNQPVVLVSISWSPQACLGFLHRMTQDWKDKHIDWFIAQSPLWSGTPLSLMAYVSGVPQQPALPTPPKYDRFLATSVHVTMAIFPRPGHTQTLYNESEVLVTTPDFNYTAFNISNLLAHMGMRDQIEAWEAIQNDTDLLDFAHPGVDTFVTYGTGLNTPGSFGYDTDFVANPNVVPPTPATILLDPDTGDGYVPFRSAVRGWYKWKDSMAKEGKRLLYKGYPGQLHAACINGCHNDVWQVLVKGTAPDNAWDNLHQLGTNT